MNGASKILTRAELLERFAPDARSGVVVFTNGCFDILHRGHVEYLQGARALGDTLIVALNTDASVQRLKGPGRPINSQEDRAVVIAALECVSAVTLFGESTPRELLATLLPDVLVKGADYSLEQVVGREEVERAGGRVVLLPLVPGRSTTAILQRSRDVNR